MSFGYRIKELRKDKEWSQEFVAEKLHISIGALSRYENGMFEPKSLELVSDFATLFNVSTDYLLGKSDIRNIEELKNVQFANNGGLDINGLDKEELNELQRQIDFIKKMKEKNNGNH